MVAGVVIIGIDCRLILDSSLFCLTAPLFTFHGQSEKNCFHDSDDSTIVEKVPYPAESPELSSPTKHR